MVCISDILSLSLYLSPSFSSLFSAWAIRAKPTKRKAAELVLDDSDPEEEYMGDREGKQHLINYTTIPQYYT